MEQRDYDSRTALHVAAAEGTVPSHSICCLSVCQLALEHPCCLCAFLLLSVQKWYLEVHALTELLFLQDTWMLLSFSWKRAK